MPSEFALRLQKGIAGGFAPPTPSAIYSFNKAASNPMIIIEAAERIDGTPDLQTIGPRTLPYDEIEVGASSADAASSQAVRNETRKRIDELEAILRNIPTEIPPGIQDIYRLDTGIMWQSDDFIWANCGPGGCGDGTSEVQPTKEDRSKFKRAVEIVNELNGLAK